MLHIEFCLKVFKLQRNRGAYFLMEHPAFADSWKLECVEEFRKSEGEMEAVADQCMYGLKTHGPVPERVLMAAKKPTRLMSNSWCVLHELSTRCDHSHEHQELMGGRASNAAEYPDVLCRAICRGLANQKKYDASGRVCTGNVDAETPSSLITDQHIAGVLLSESAESSILQGIHMCCHHEAIQTVTLTFWW